MYFFYTPILYFESDSNNNPNFKSGSNFLSDFGNYLDQYFGKIHHYEIENNKIFITTYNDSENLEQKDISPYFLHKFLSEYIFGLWLLKDNSIYNGSIFVFNPNKGWFNRGNSLNAISTANGLFVNTYFSEEDLITAKKYSDKFKTYNLKNYVSITKPDNLKPLKFKHNFINALIRENYNNFHRITRSYDFIFLARTTLNLIEKISHYIIAIETLFIPTKLNSRNIKTVIVDRLAIYLTEVAKEKEKIKHNIIDAYNIRSNYFHGSSIENPKYFNIDKLSELSSKLDNYLREIFLDIFSDHDKGKIFLNNDDTNSFF